MNLGSAEQYTVTARNAVGTVAMSSAALNLFSMQLANGSPRLTVAAPVGSRFRLDYASILGSGANWQLMTNLTMTGSVMQAEDARSPGSPARFYRAVMMP